MKHFVRSLAFRLGYDLRRINPALPREGQYRGYDLEEEAYTNVRIVRSHTMLTYERLITLYQQAVFCETSGVQGSFVECGTWKGGAIGLMALANLKYGVARRQLHLFDSFEGVPEPDEAVDGAAAIQAARQVGGQARGQLVALPLSVGALQANRDLLEQVIGYDSAHLNYHKGWFQETLPLAAAEVGSIAILRLDGDWYASTKVCLAHLYDQVTEGGFIIIDDYGEFEGCRMAVDEFLKERGIKAYLNHIDYAGRYWIKN